MLSHVNAVQIILGLVLILSSIGVIAARKPVHSGLSFLLALLTLSAFYLQLSAQFIAVMQILVYAGAILVIFMFVIVLFQDAHVQIERHEAQSSPLFLSVAAAVFLAGFILLGTLLLTNNSLGEILRISPDALPESFGTVQSLGYALYIKFFFPFEAVILLFLVAVVGALYVGKKVKTD